MFRLENIYDHLLTQPGTSCPAYVKDLWHLDTKQWDEQIISSHFDDDFKNQILQIPIIKADFEDEICWIHTPNAQCTTKSAYKCFPQVALTSSRISISPAEKEIWWQVWRNKRLAPRVKTFAWRLIRRALATGARASKFSKHIAKECSRCGMLETDSHLFFHCTFAKAVWFSTTLGLRTDAYDTTLYPSNIIHAMLQIHQPENSVDKIFTLLWCIWKARNDFLFNKKI